MRLLCCGQKPRARLIDGELVEQPHKCQDADVEPDWPEFQEQQIRPLPKEGSGDGA